MIQFVLGGTRSGKSRFAQQLAVQSDKQVVYVATATEIDAEMRERIKRHQDERPKDWELVERPYDLAEFFESSCYCDKFIIVDCLTLWLNNLLFRDKDCDVQAHTKQLTNALLACNCNVILVSNEVGLGIIPMGEVSRRFVDEAGRMNQSIANIADEVNLIAAGIPMQLESAT